MNCRWILYLLLLIVGKPIFLNASPIYGLSAGNLLLRFDSATPGTIVQVLLVSGLQNGEILQGIDFRPATGDLFGVGNSNRLYLLSTNTGAATAVGSPGAFTLSGTAFGFDFNPTVDRIRVVSDADQNIRLNPNDGTLAATDVLLNPGNPNVVGCAYLNNYLGATATTLYGIDSGSDTLVIQNPPNNGSLITVGPLGFNTGPLCGFDISARNEAFAALTAPGDTASKLFQINLSTGAATLIGNIGGGALISDIAIVPLQMVRFTSAQYSATELSGKATISLTRFNNSAGSITVNYSTAPGTATPGLDYQPVSGTVIFGPGETNRSFDVPVFSDGLPELNETVLLSISSTDSNVLVAGLTNATLAIQSAEELPVYLLTDSNQLLRFSTSPSLIQTNVAITGLQPGETLLAIDFRPATGELFGLGNSNRLYSVNPNTGAATAVGSPGGFTLSGTNFGFDFNPTVDRIRVVSDSGQNIRLNPLTGALAAIDVNLNPGSPNVVAAAYTHNYAGATVTALYGIDSSLDALVLQNPPNNGTLTTVGVLGVDITGEAGFDITQADQAYAVFKRAAASASEIYRIDLATGAATLAGVVNSPAVVRDLAIAEPQPVLKIAQAGTNALLSWPAGSLGYVLENTVSLSSPAWTTNLPAPVLVNDQKVVTNQITTNRFFRLKK